MQLVKAVVALQGLAVARALHGELKSMPIDE